MGIDSFVLTTHCSYRRKVNESLLFTNKWNAMYATLGKIYGIIFVAMINFMHFKAFKMYKNFHPNLTKFTKMLTKYFLSIILKFKTNTF